MILPPCFPFLQSVQSLHLLIFYRLFFVFLHSRKFSLNTKFLLTSLLLFLFTYFCHFCCHLIPLLKFGWCSLNSRREHLLVGGFIGPMGWDASEAAVHILHLCNIICLTTNLGRNQSLANSVVKTCQTRRWAQRVQGGIRSGRMKRYRPPIWENWNLANSIVFLSLYFFHKCIGDLTILTSWLSRNKDVFYRSSFQHSLILVVLKS